MNPDVVKEILQIVNEVSESVYMAARHKVIVTNIMACLALLPTLVAAIWFTIYSRKRVKTDDSSAYEDSDWYWGVIVGAITTICIYSSIACVITNLLTADYRTYLAIRALLF